MAEVVEAEVAVAPFEAVYYSSKVIEIALADSKRL